MKYIWRNREGEPIDLDTIQDKEYLRNIVKMLMRHVKTQSRKVDDQLWFLNNVEKHGHINEEYWYAKRCI